MRPVFTVLVVLVLPGCTALMLGDGSTGAYEPPPRNQGGATMTMSDATIVSAIGGKFDADPGLTEFGLGIRSDGGSVTLSGAVDTWAARERAERLAIATDGVRAVNNQIRVEGIR